MYIVEMTRKILTMGGILVILWASGCADSGEAPLDPADMPKISREGLDAVREYRNEPIHRARMTQSLGDERTRAIDDALKQ
jgi:hypothetical protein